MAEQPLADQATSDLPEQDFVDAAYERLDALRDSYRERQRRAHAEHGVDNAQAWTERDAISSHLGDMAARLEGVEDRLVFGRLDMSDGQVRRIGRTSLSTPAGPPLLIDWRAPAAMPFYQATAVEPLGVARRRHITTRARRVIAIEDELLDSAAGGIELQGEGALMAALSSARDGRMGDIVATIQSEQDRIVRADEKGIVVVQGGPGTGKTAVALHRIAYLLYAERERLQRSGVLLVGPSRIFLRYIEQVLPSLGETGVVSTTLGDLIPGTSATGAEPLEVAQAKGRPGWERILAQAVKSLPRPLDAPVALQVWNRSVDLLPEDVSAALKRARRSRKPHNEAREGFALDLMKRLAKRLALAAGDGDSEGRVPEDVLNSWTIEVRDSLDARRAINLAWMPTSAKTLLARLYARPSLLARLNAAAGSPLSARELRLLARQDSNWTPADVPLLDELEELLGPLPHRAPRRSATEAEEVERARAAIEGQGLGGGIVTAEQLAASARGEGEWTPLAERAANDRQWAYGHIVVDEAQDLSPMAWRALLRRCPARSMTIVGDLDQRRGAHRPSTWEQALGPAARALEAEYVLTVSYRTPRALTELAERVMARAGEPVLHPMTAVRDVPDCYRVLFAQDSGQTGPGLDEAVNGAVEEAVRRLDSESGPGSGRVAVIVGARRALEWKADVSGMSGLDSRVSVLSAVAAKGLEFDSVVLVEPAEIASDGLGDLFVALTRSTHDLTVVHHAPLPAGMEEW